MNNPKSNQPITDKPKKSKSNLQRDNPSSQKNPSKSDQSNTNIQKLSKRAKRSLRQKRSRDRKRAYEARHLRKQDSQPQPQSGNNSDPSPNSDIKAKPVNQDSDSKPLKRFKGNSVTLPDKNLNLQDSGDQPEKNLKNLNPFHNKTRNQSRSLILRTKTSKGQPIMDVKVAYLLEKIERKHGTQHTRGYSKTKVPLSQEEKFDRQDANLTLVFPRKKGDTKS